MRILKLRFENLNSLYGQWEIDFTGGEFAGNGIFAIVGATGAGKSTVLDAIALALYGRTPRLGVVSAGSNEIMSRGKGECSAEVYFEISGVQYSAHWSQKRARGKSGGKLQPHRHRLDNITTAEPVAEKISQTRISIEELTGMNFDQFTRAMLLAQGEFSKFLKANTSERSEILENITDTADYSLISVAVHERRRREEDMLSGLKSGLDGISLLSADKIQGIESDIALTAESESKLKSREEELRRVKELYVSQETLRKHHDELAVQREELERRQQDFSEKKLQLVKAEAAESCWQEYLHLKKMQDKLDSESKLLNENLESLMVLRKDLDDSEAGYLEQQNKLATVKENFTAEHKILRSVRDLDVKLQNYYGRLRELKNDEAKIRSHISVASEEVAGIDKECLLYAEELRVSEYYLQEHKEDASLVEKLNSLIRDMQELAVAGANNSKLAGKLDSLVIKKNQLREEYEDEKKLSAEIQGRSEKVNSEIMKLQQQYELLLSGSSIGAYRRDYEKYGERLKLLDDLGGLLEQQSASAVKVEQLRNKVSVCNENILKIKDICNQVSSAESDVLREQEHLELGLKYYEQVKTLEKRREELVDGEECPLCGSREHPFVVNGAPEINEFELRLKDVRGRLKLIDEELVHLKASTSHEQGILEAATAGLRSEEDNYTLLSSKIAAFLARIDLTADIDLTEYQVAEVQSIHDNLERIKTVIIEAEALDKIINEFKGQLVTVKDSLLKQEKITGGMLAAEREVAAQELHLREELELSAERLNSLKEELKLSLAAYGYVSDNWEAVQLDIIAIELRKRADEYKHAADNAENCRHQIELRTVRKKELCRNLDHERGRLLELAELQVTVEQEQRDCYAQRCELYGTKDCDAEEDKFNAQISSMEQVLEEMSIGSRVCREKVTRCVERIEALKDNIEVAKTELQTMQSDFDASITAKGFSSESEFCASRLDSDLLMELKLERTGIEDSIKHNEQQRGDNLRKLEALELSLAEAPSQEFVAGELERVTGERSALLESLGALKNTLYQQSQLYAQYSAKSQEILKQQEVCRRWGHLHELIGSADGKKFRNFAQGLTFDILLKYANRELLQMNDRYLLCRSTVDSGGNAESLELDVIDKDQAGEIRSAKNLSGGESFIVSLALALGLSNMSSRKVEVNSLFLDEGFGTLDDAELDKVLSALSQIQQRGKLIGIISHVSALKERISLQLVIEKGAGGRSVIAGPGCKKL